ncbi:MAG: gamma-glutamylcyclotransferase family protein [Chloroflexota bacterium]
MNYFAYGSNLSTAYIRDYCPSATFIMRASLPNYEIQFRRYSTDLQGGISSIIETPGAMVQGVLYDIEESELAALDILEDVPQGIYLRETFLVLGEDDSWHHGDLYRVANPAGPYTPSKKYVDFMVAGAKEHGIEAAYTAKLVALRALLD